MNYGKIEVWQGVIVILQLSRFYFLHLFGFEFEDLYVFASKLRMVGLQWQLGPGELLIHQTEELLHRVQLLLTLPLLKCFTNQFAILKGKTEN